MKSRNINKIEIGGKYYDELGAVVVLCFVEKNYLVARRPKCAPFIITLNEFSKRFKSE